MLTKKQAYYFYRLRAKLKDQSFLYHMSKLKNHRHNGVLQFWEAVCVQLDEPTIIFDPRKATIETILIHEVLHAVYPRWSESKVCYWTSRISNNLSQRQWKNLMQLLFSKLVTGEYQKSLSWRMTETQLGEDASPFLKFLFKLRGSVNGM